MNKTKSLLIFFLFALISICIITSCADSRKLTYFNNIPRDTTIAIPFHAEQALINKNDILKVAIATLDEQTTKVLNGLNAVPDANGATLQSIGMLSGYLVDEDGIIKIPMLCQIKAAGLTKTELAAYITRELVTRKIAIDPVVSVRIINYRITVLGEVNKPGVIPVANEQITLPEAIAFAGDLTPYGRRDNVLLMREVAGKRVYKRFSLNDNQLFDKDLFYLQNQDVIYVSPDKAKAGLSDRATQILPIVLGALSLITIILSQVFYHR